MSEPDDSLAQLLREAGAPDGPDSATLERLRAHAHAEWRAGIRRRRRARVQTWALAASVVLALSIVLSLASRTPARPVAVARLLNPDVAASGATIARASRTTQQLAADALAVGDVLAAGPRAVALRLQGDDPSAALRIDAGTRIRWRGARELELLTGRMYVDSGTQPRAPGQTLEIRVGQARVRHVGTQYIVARVGDAARVVVREGRVRIDLAADTAQIVRGQAAAFAASGGTIRSGSAALDDADWTWADALTPQIELEGRDLRSVLVELARATGRPLRFATDEAERQARETILHGPALDLPPADALQTLLATSGFTSVADATTDLVIAVR